MATTIAPDCEPVANETRDRLITGFITVAPIACLFVVGWQVWAEFLGWSDVAVFAILYALTGFGVTVGFHCPLPPRAFKTTRPIPAALAVLGSHSPGGHPEITLTDVRVPAENLLGNEGEGFVIAQKRLAGGRLAHAMRWIGVSQRALDLTSQRLLTRKAFGKELARHQSPQVMIEIG